MLNHHWSLGNKNLFLGTRLSAFQRAPYHLLDQSMEEARMICVLNPNMTHSVPSKYIYTLIRGSMLAFEGLPNYRGIIFNVKIVTIIIVVGIDTNECIRFTECLHYAP